MIVPALGVDPRADSRNGEYVIVKPPGWSQARWDAYQRGLGGGAGTMTDSAEFEGMWIAVEKYDAVVAENERLREALRQCQNTDDLYIYNLAGAALRLPLIKEALR